MESATAREAQFSVKRHFAAKMGDTVTLSVFWEGTAHALGTTNVGRFAFANEDQDITFTDLEAIPQGDAFKMMFDGCGITNGCLGTLLMAGLRPPCTVPPITNAASLEGRGTGRGGQAPNNRPDGTALSPSVAAGCPFS